MIRKTLTVAVTEQEEGSHMQYDVMLVTKGPDGNSVILQPVNPGKLLIQKKDLVDAVAELEKFYGDIPTVSNTTPALVATPTPATVEMATLQVEFGDDENEV